MDDARRRPDEHVRVRSRETDGRENTVVHDRQLVVGRITFVLLKVDVHAVAVGIHVGLVRLRLMYRGEESATYDACRCRCSPYPLPPVCPCLRVHGCYAIRRSRETQRNGCLHPVG